MGNMSMRKYQMEGFIKKESTYLFDRFVSGYDCEDEDLVILRWVFNSILIKTLGIEEVKIEQPKYSQTFVVGFKRHK